jgi:hypothetical protein
MATTPFPWQTNNSNAPSPLGSPSPPQSAFDGRLIEVDIQLPNQPVITFSSGNPQLAIYATGSKFASSLMNSCECRIFNLTKQLRNTILTLASPQIIRPVGQPARQPVLLTVKAGRQSYGTQTFYFGNVISCDVTQPPDIGITLRALANNFQMGIIQNLQFPANTLLSQIAAQAADRNSLTLDFEVTPDKQINNFSYNGPANGLIQLLNQMGGVQAYQDNGVLVVLNSGSPRKGANIQISESTGMVGIPQVTEYGVAVKVMFNPLINLGGQVTITSITNPAANGTYKVFKIDYEIASRDTPFWMTLGCNVFAYGAGTQ